MHLCDGNCRSKFVLNGADLMLPGVLVPRHRFIFIPVTSFDPFTYDDDSTMTRIHSTQLSGCGASGAGQRSRWLRNRHKGAAPWRNSENCENPRN